MSDAAVARDRPASTLLGDAIAPARGTAGTAGDALMAMLRGGWGLATPETAVPRGDGEVASGCVALSPTRVDGPLGDALGAPPVALCE